MEYRDHITSNPNVMLGKPCIKGTRITVELILEKLSQGASVPDILTIYPHLTSEEIYIAIEYGNTLEYLMQHPLKTNSTKPLTREEAHERH